MIRNLRFTCHSWEAASDNKRSDQPSRLFDALWNTEGASFQACELAENARVDPWAMSKIGMIGLKARGVFCFWRRARSESGRLPDALNKPAAPQGGVREYHPEDDGTFDFSKKRGLFGDKLTKKLIEALTGRQGSGAAMTTKLQNA